MANNPNEPLYNLYTIRLGSVNTPGYVREFDAMFAALPADVKASAKAYPYPDAYDFCYTVELTPHPGPSKVNVFPLLLEAMMLLPGAPREGITRMLQQLRREKAAMESQPAQDMPAAAGAPKVDLSDQRLIRLYKNIELSVPQILEKLPISRSEYYRRLKPHFDNGTLERRASQKRPKRGT